MAVARTGPKTLALCNMKGGVGKTAGAVNTAAALALQGHRTLLVDCDYQSNATDYLGVKLQAVINKMTLFDGITRDKSIEDCILPTRFENLSIVASSTQLSYWEKQSYKNHKIRSWFDCRHVENNFDYVIFDTRPQIGNLFDNVMSYVDWYLVPLFPEADALSGLQIVFKELREVQEAYNSDLKCAGLLITKFKPKNSTHTEFRSVIESICDEYSLPFLGSIPDSDALSGSVNKCTPFPFYLSKPHLPIRYAYMALAERLIENLIHKKGRIPLVPEIPNAVVIETMKQMSETPAIVQFE